MKELKHCLKRVHSNPVESNHIVSVALLTPPRTDNLILLVRQKDNLLCCEE